MGPQVDAGGTRRAHGMVHDHRVAGMMAAGDVGGGDDFHHRRVVAHAPCAEPLAEIRIEVDPHVAQRADRHLDEPFSKLDIALREVERERLGTTGVGDGVAIPHGKLANLPRLFGLFARLERPIDFEAIDEQPVDLIFLLLAPGGAGADHLKALARVSRLLRDRSMREKLRGSETPEALYALLVDQQASAA